MTDKEVELSDSERSVYEEWLRTKETLAQIKSTAQEVQDWADKLKEILLASLGLDDPEAEPPEEPEVTLGTIDGQPVIKAVLGSTTRVVPALLRRFYPDAAPHVSKTTTTRILNIVRED